MTIQRCHLRSGAEPRLHLPGRSVESRVFLGRDRRRARRDPGCFHRDLGRDVGADSAAGVGCGARPQAPAAAGSASERCATIPAGELVWAADQFIFTPVGRQEDTARARAAGDEIRSVIAGYHWFTDWGRDTMISLEGLTLTTGRAGRSQLHPAHLRALHPRRSDPQHVPGRKERTGCIILPTPRSGSFTPSPLLSSTRTTSIC